ncbi:MAG: helix-turn-helix transcriptional regulator [Actinomycetota bacterium]
MSSQTLVPPGRLGALLIEHRQRAGCSVADLAARSPRFSPSELDRLERGGTELADRDVEAVLGLYGVDLTAGTYGRSQLVVDLPAHTVAVGDTKLRFDAPTADVVLERYVSLLYLLREQPVGTQLPLRAADLDTLGSTLDRPELTLIDDLHAIMGDRRTVGRTRRLSRRPRVLRAGVLVGATVVGALVMIGDVLPASASPVTGDASAQDELAGGVITVQSRSDVVLAGTGLDLDRLLPAWSVEWAGDHPVYGGLTDANDRRITMYVDPDWSSDRLADIFVHEVGHALDLEYLDDATRLDWMQMRGISVEAGWWAGNGEEDFAVGAGDFAEAVATAVLGTPSDSAYGAFSVDELDYVRSLLETMAAKQQGVIR